MNRYFFLFLTAAVLLTGGCAPTVLVEGQRYYALTGREIEHLILISRGAMQVNCQKGVITQEELQLVRREKPGINIKYNGDKFGRAEISWQSRERILTMVFLRELDAERPMCNFKIEELPPQERGLVRPDRSLPGR